MPVEKDASSPELSAIVLCYRAGDKILRVADPLYALLTKSGLDFELVLVANYWPGMEDDTPEYVLDFADMCPRAVTVVRSKEGGMGWDMRAGLDAARGRILIVIDGDAQNPVTDVLAMYRQMVQTGYDVMKGRRISRFDGINRRLMSFVYNALFRIVFRTKGLWDINGKPKGMTRDAYRRMDLRSTDWFVDAEIVLVARRLGLSIGELPVVFRASERESFVRMSAIGEFIVNIVSYRVRGRPRG